MKDFYYILGVNQSATIDDVKKAYRKLSLKFHPDKNEGDPFFTDRFKEIQEAYETLSDSTRRSVYDKKKFSNSNAQSTSNRNNFTPEIEFFNSSRDSYEFEEEITFSWRTINANKVSISPFGEVQPIGKKTYKFKDFKNESLTFKLITENTNIERKTSSILILKNRTYTDLYNSVKEKIEEENYNKKKNAQQQKADEEKGKIKVD